MQVAVAAGGLQRRAELPALRQAQAGFDADIACVMARGIQQQTRPLHRHQFGGHGHASLVAGRGREPLEFNVEHGDATRHLYFKRIHVQRIAAPRHALAIGRHHQPTHLVDGSGGCMVARNPLWVPQLQRPRLHGNALAHLVEAERQVGDIHGKLQYAGIVFGRHRGRSWCLCQGAKRPQQQHGQQDAQQTGHAGGLCGNVARHPTACRHAGTIRRGATPGSGCWRAWPRLPPTAARCREPAHRLIRNHGYPFLHHGHATRHRRRGCCRW